MNKTRNDLVSYCLQSAGVCVRKCLAEIREIVNEGRNCVQSQSVRDRNRQSKTCFLYYCDDQTAVQRDIQVTDSDIYLCTQVLTVTPSETACVSKGEYATKSVFNGQWGYIVGVYWFLLHPYTCVILDGTTGNRIVTISPETS